MDTWTSLDLSYLKSDELVKKEIFPFSGGRAVIIFPSFISPPFGRGEEEHFGGSID
jgi:hypothetical protein